MARWAFDILEIEVTKDKKEIKRAYAALVKKYHPEEQPIQWARAKEAYEAAIKYAESDLAVPEGERAVKEQRAVPESESEVKEQPVVSEEALHAEDNYSDRSRQEGSEWKQQSEHEEMLVHRMYELMKIKTKKAYEEWKLFFENEFLAEESPAVMIKLLEIVRAYPLSMEVIQMIIIVMEKRAVYYQNNGEEQKKMLAEAITEAAKGQLPKQYEQDIKRGNSRPKRKKSRSFISAFGVIVFCFILISGISIGRSRASRQDVIKAASDYLNEKYGNTGYSEKDFTADSVYMYGDDMDEIQAYRITDKNTYDTLVYVLMEKGKTKTAVCFDNLQETEIKKAFQSKINSLTGYEDGKLFWNTSSGNSSSKFEDGYFQTFFDGDIETFIETESEVRASALGEKKMKIYGNATAENGNCDYYIPDSEIETMEQRFQMKELKEDQALQAVLEECAEKYKVQLRGIMLPQSYFFEKMNQIEWERESLWVSEDIYVSYMYPPLPLLLMTGWYVNVPVEDEELLEIHNGMYGAVPRQTGEGIYSAANAVSMSYADAFDQEMNGSFVNTDTPDSVQLNDNQKKKAVSLQLSGDKKLNQNYCLAIDKAVYQIADAGYRVFLTKSGEDGDETMELYVNPYSSTDAEAGYSNAMDGEGYLFLEYPQFWEGEKPPVVTIVNP